MKQLQYRIRPYIGQENPAKWLIADSSRVVKKGWHKVKREAGSYAGETEYRIVDLADKVAS
jgi:hypothetical protein